MSQMAYRAIVAPFSVGRDASPLCAMATASPVFATDRSDSPIAPGAYVVIYCC